MLMQGAYSSTYHFFLFLAMNACVDSSLPKASSDLISLLGGLLQKNPQKRYVRILF